MPMLNAPCPMTPPPLLPVLGYRHPAPLPHMPSHGMPHARQAISAMHAKHQHKPRAEYHFVGTEYDYPSNPSGRALTMPLTPIHQAVSCTPGLCSLMACQARLISIPSSESRLPFSGALMRLCPRTYTNLTRTPIDPTIITLNVILCLSCLDSPLLCISVGRCLVDMSMTASMSASGRAWSSEQIQVQSSARAWSSER